MAYLIPDVPQYIVVQMQREHYMAKQALYNRAYATGGVVAGTSDTIIGGRGGAAAGSVEAGKGNGVAPTVAKQPSPEVKGSKGSPGSVKSEFRYSPVDSVDSGDEKKDKTKKTLKAPIRRL